MPAQSGRRRNPAIAAAMRRIAFGRGVIQDRDVLHACFSQNMPLHYDATLDDMALHCVGGDRLMPLFYVCAAFLELL